MKKTILATGADMKNRFLLAKGIDLRFGPDIGDLSDAKNYDLFSKEISRAIKKSRPNIIAHDLHPGYFSTRFLQYIDKRSTINDKRPIQHHHAHIASVIWEHDIKKPVIGISFDGTGYGTDGNMWGGEFLLVGKKGFKRLGHFKYLKMPGADKAAMQPWRMVLSMLGRDGFPFVKAVGENDKELVLSMMARNINSPLTSSVGRLFDAAASLMGICETASYEAQGPMKLEAMCDEKIVEGYEFRVERNGSMDIIDAAPVFAGMVTDLNKGKSKKTISAKFHNSMVRIIINTVKKLSKETGIKAIALSGGVFQNRYLKMKTVAGLKKCKLNVFTNEKMPVNDLNISVGQYYVSCDSGKN